MAVIYEYAKGSLRIPSIIPDHSSVGIKGQITAGVALNFGDFFYIDSNGKAQLGDSDAISTTGTIGMADESIALNATGRALYEGIARDDTWTFTAGQDLFASRTGTTGNTITADILTSIGTDDVVQSLGKCIKSKYIYVKPNLMQIEHI